MRLRTQATRRTRTYATSALLLTAGLAIAILAAVDPSSALRPPASHALRPSHGVRPTAGLGLHPEATRPGTSGQFACQEPSATFHCYGPAQIRTAYAIQPLLNDGRNGSGEVITIIDAYQNPTMTSDLATFDSAFSLHAPPSFQTIAPFGLTPFDASNPEHVGWSGEIALDVEWAHAVAPRARIVLALAPSDSSADLLATERYVIQHHIGDVISMSYIEAEQCEPPGLLSEEHSLFASATARGVTLVAGSGDWGAAQFSCDESSFIKAVGAPASDPNVTGVGGTELRANLQTGAYSQESIWQGEEGAGGGGFSTFFSRPSFQNGVKGIGATRGVPDVSMTASGAFGVLVAWGSSGEPYEFWNDYGTSGGTPIWAAIVAIADQSAGQGLGNINPALYRLSRNAKAYAHDFHDITVGNNDFPPIEGYRARPGWDAASGLGSPIADNLVADLIGR